MRVVAYQLLTRHEELGYNPFLKAWGSNILLLVQTCILCPCHSHTAIRTLLQSNAHNQRQFNSALLNLHVHLPCAFFCGLQALVCLSICHTGHPVTKCTLHTHSQMQSPCAHEHMPHRASSDKVHTTHPFTNVEPLCA